MSRQLYSHAGVRRQRGSMYGGREEEEAERRSGWQQSSRRRSHWEVRLLRFRLEGVNDIEA